MSSEQLPTIQHRIGAAINANDGRCTLIEETLLECLTVAAQRDELLASLQALVLTWEGVPAANVPGHVITARVAVAKTRGTS